MAPSIPRLRAHFFETDIPMGLQMPVILRPLLLLLHCLIPLFILPGIVHSQIYDRDYYSLLENHELAELRQRLLKEQQHQPGQVASAYYLATLEPEAALAFEQYRQVAEREGRSDFAGRARYRLGQYYFALGSYDQARQLFVTVAQQHPGSSLATPAAYYAAKALLASGAKTAALPELQQLVNDHTGTWMADFALDDIGRVDEKLYEHLKRAPAAPSSYFTLQVGAFSEYDRALAQERTFTRAGYKTSIKPRREQSGVLYLVWVGRFASESEAKISRTTLQERFQIEALVVASSE